MPTTEATAPWAGTLRRPGAVLLIACYELGHQPLGVASPLGWLEQAGYAPEAMDISVERFDVEKVAQARFIGIAVPMHTALRLGMRVAERIRDINPTCHICCYGLYAALNAKYLLAHGADSVIGGECEGPLVALVASLDAGDAGEVEGVSRRGRMTGPFLKRLDLRVPSRHALPPLTRYAHLERGGLRVPVGYVEASRAASTCACIVLFRQCMAGGFSRSRRRLCSRTSAVWWTRERGISPSAMPIF
jgi:radical SAM superfamily enzyme YgiQ (UPF0313 family)